MRMPMIVFLTASHIGSAMSAAEPAPKFRFEAPADWKQERIALPPTFARDMQLKGTEDVRFAPGMFQSQSDSFFSYMFVFQLDTKPELTQKVIEREFLVYYRGLASAVLKNRNVKLDTSKFVLKLKAAKVADSKQKHPQGLKQYAGDLKWVEPFVTRKPQTLHLEIQSWAGSKTNHNYLFAVVSPQQSTAAIWKTMRNLRAAFHRANQSEGPATAVRQQRGYSIPTLDLAGQIERQVVVDREKGKYLGHPAAVLPEDNKTVIAVYPQRHGRRAIVMKRSADAGPDLVGTIAHPPKLGRGSRGADAPV